MASVIASVLLAIITALISIIIYYQKSNSDAINARIDNCERRDEVIRKEQSADIKNIMNVVGNLKCAENSSMINKIAGMLEMSIKNYERTLDGHSSDIKNLYHHKNEIKKDIAFLQRKVLGNEEIDSKTKAFRKEFVNVNCLLVDDNDMVLEGIVDVGSQRLGFNFDTAKSVKEAKTALRNKPYDCMILDYCLKDGTARDIINYCDENNYLLKKNGTKKKDRKILIISGKENISVPLGVHSIEKPIDDWEKMCDIMEKILS